MKPFLDVLNEFDSTLKAYNYSNYIKLQEPLPKEDILAYLKEMELENEDVFNLYSWKNGDQDPSQPSMLFSFECGMLSLQSATDYKTRNIFRLSNDFRGLVALFDNGEDAFLFNSTSGDNFGKIHLYCVSLLSIDEPNPYYDSLNSMIETIINQYKYGGITFDKNLPFPVRDTELYVKIYNQFNPICNFYEKSS